MNQIYNDKMKEVYAKAYKGAYKYKPKSLYISAYVIKNDLELINKYNNQLITLNNVFNIGTGREAINYLNYAKNVYHCDISEYAVNSLLKYIKKNKISTLYSTKIDICSEYSNLSDRIGLNNKKVDLVYLNGIIQHLYNINKAIANIDDILRKEGILFLRTYKKGFFLFELIRIIRRLNLKLKDIVKSCTYIDNKIYADFVDDVFVPTLLLYDVNDLIDSFDNYGYVLLNIAEVKTLNNNCNENTLIGFDDSVEFILKKENNLKSCKFNLKYEDIDNLSISSPLLFKINKYLLYLNNELIQQRISQKFFILTIFKIYEMAHPINSHHMTVKQCIEKIEQFILHKINSLNTIENNDGGLL